MKTYPVKIISPGIGSSGYYLPEALRQAGEDRIFDEGTQMFWNHDGPNEQFNRPAGDMKRLAAVLTSPARYEDQGIDGAGLYSDALVFSDYENQVDEKGRFTGLSIVAEGEGEYGEVGDFKGLVIKKLTKGHSVDFVTKAGRDGKILFESATATEPTMLLSEVVINLDEAANTGNWLEAMLHKKFTILADDMFADGYLNREERITLSGAIGEGLTVFNARIKADAPQLYEREPWRYAPDENDTVMQENALLKSKLEAIGQKDKNDMSEELIQEVEQLKQANQALTARLAMAEARQVITAVFEDSQFKAVPQPMRQQFTEIGLLNVPMTEGALNAPALKEVVSNMAKTYVESLPAQGTSVRDNGESSNGVLETFQEASITKLMETYGLDRKQAERAYGV